MQKSRSRSILELMWEDRNQHIQESLRPTDACLYQHTRDSQGRRVDDSYEEHASTSLGSDKIDRNIATAESSPASSSNGNFV
ncbi:hypothetical protein V6N12_035565 [Hibiscus sabdariffa]|uniref:Uncharacterized protein n=1 Tax=Hibiscus sabdariffa TaxID=183260 RepID=A0ABR2EQI0_9ROSI